MKDNISIRKINSADIHDIALIHIVSFKKSLLTHLGIDIVKKYYEWQLISPDSVYPYGIFFKQRLVGYCFGGSFRMALGGFLLRNKKIIFFSLLKRPWVLVNPIFIKKIILGMTVFYRFVKIKKIEKKNFLNKTRKNFGILAIATNPEIRGKGFGKRLMVFFEKIAQKESYQKIRLSVSPKNHRAIDFYLDLGYKKKIFSNDNSWDGTMEKIIGEFKL